MTQLDRSKKNQLTAFLGATVILFLAMSWKLGFLSTNRTHEYRIYLRDASGLVQDNAVKIAGVKVGRIANLSVEHDRAQLLLEVSADTKLHAGASALVRAKSLLGEKYLEILPGDANAALLPPGSELGDGQGSFDVDELLNALEPVMRSEGGLPARLEPWIHELERLHALLQQPENRERIARSASQVEQTIADTAAITASLRRLLEAHEAEIGQSIHALSVLAKDPALPQMLKEAHVVSRALAHDVPPMLAASSSTLAEVNTVSARLRTLLTEERVAELGKAMDTIANSAAPLADAIAIAHEVAKDVDAFRKGMNGKGESLVQTGKQAAKIVAGLELLLSRLVRIDELAIRKFVQEEGIRVKLGTAKGARQRIDALSGE